MLYSPLYIVYTIYTTVYIQYTVAILYTVYSRDTTRLLIGVFGTLNIEVVGIVISFFCLAKQSDYSPIK